jgi:hypothetical protein
VTAPPEPVAATRATRERRVLLAPFAALAALIVLVAALSGHLHLGVFHQQLRSEPMTGSAVSGGWRGVQFRDAAGREVAAASISATTLTPNLSLLYVQFTHREDLSVSDLSLRFSYGPFRPTLALDQTQLPGWPSAQWTAEDSGIERASLQNLGTLGRGNVFLQFYVGVGPQSQLALENPTLEVEATITSGGLVGSFVGSQATGSIPLFTPQDLAVPQ